MTFRLWQFHTANVIVVNLHCLLSVLAPLHVLFVDHDLLDEQPQQLRRQLPDVRVPLCQGDKVVGAGHLLPQPLDGSFLFWDGLIQRFHLLGVAAGERLELLRCDPPQNTVLIKALEDAVQFLAPLLQSGRWIMIMAGRACQLLEREKSPLWARAVTLTLRAGMLNIPLT